MSRKEGSVDTPEYLRPQSPYGTSDSSRKYVLRKSTDLPPPSEPLVGTPRSLKLRVRHFLNIKVSMNKFFLHNQSPKLRSIWESPA